MSASQMRYVMISGEKSDTEFQGQQINQQRTTLATETSALNAQLLDINVPTPPSSDQFVTTSYSFTGQDANAATITGTKSNGDGTWKVNYTEDVVKDQGQYGNTSNFTQTTDGSGNKVITIGGTLVYSTLANVDQTADTTATANTTQDQADINSYNIDLICADTGVSRYSTSGGTDLTRINSTNGTVSAAAQKAITDSTGSYSAGNTYYSYPVTTGTGSSAVTKTYYLSEADLKAAMTNGTAIKGKDTTQAVDPSGVKAQENKFYSFTSAGTTLYFPESAIGTTDTSGTISGYKAQKDASVKQSFSMDVCDIHWASSGRMSSIDQLDSNGKIAKTYDLSVATTNDNTAYQDAYNEYQYQKSQYDNKLEGINAKITIVQTNDKKLELKLQDLDTKQKALSTEMDSVKKVVEKNIEASYKAFA